MVTRTVFSLPAAACLCLMAAGCTTLGQPQADNRQPAARAQAPAIDTDIQNILSAGGIDIAPAPPPDSQPVAAALQTPALPSLPPPPGATPDAAQAQPAAAMVPAPQGPLVVTSLDNAPVGVLPENMVIAGHELTIPQDLTLPSQSFGGGAVPAPIPSGILPPPPPVTETVVISGPGAVRPTAPRTTGPARPPAPAAMPASIRQKRTAAAPAWSAPKPPTVNSDKPLAPVRF